MLNAAVLSDLHFGEPYGMMHGQGAVAALNVIKHHAQGHLRRLVLAGDIFECTTPESMELVRAQARFFLQQARSRFQIDEIIWVPGNHDYSLYRRHFPSGLSRDLRRGDSAPAELVADVFGGASGVRVAYPHLLLCAPAAGRVVVVHHGQYFDSMVLGQSRGDRVAAWLSAAAGGSLLRPAQVQLGGAISLQQLEEQVRPVLSSIWKHNPDVNNLQNEAWDLVRRYDDYGHCALYDPTSSTLAVDEAAEQGQITDAEMERVRFFLRAVRRDAAYPQRLGAAERVTLLYGHTHNGGSRGEVLDGVPTRVVNLGGWVASRGPAESSRAAHTHVYLLNDDLDERLVHVPMPGGWARRCVDHGLTVFAIPGPDDDFVAQVRGAPPAAGASVDTLQLLSSAQPLGRTRADRDPFA